MLIQVDSKSVAKVFLTTVLTVLVGLLGWTASNIIEQVEKNAQALRKLERELAILDERVKALDKAVDSSGKTSSLQKFYPAGKK